MSAIQAPNHSSILTGLFEPTYTWASVSVSDTTGKSLPNSQHGNQYGVLTTPSFFQCAGYLNSEPTNFEVNLITNTALNNILEVGALYLISGRFIALNDGSTPTLTYNHDMIFRVVGESEGGPRLKVIVAHNDWDAIARIHHRFLAKYIIPGTKNFIKTHTLYQVGREIQLLGHLVNFELEHHMAVFAVHSVSLTSGHQLGQQAACPSPSGSASPRNGRRLIKFGSQPIPPAAQPPFPLQVDGGAASTSLAHNSKGKQKAISNSDINNSDSDQEATTVPDSSSQTSLPNIARRGRHRKNILQEASKRMKQT
ncbi:hypothetical protein PGTUg99_035380 [Puccinia graminis f. sp. tritici]|uniref:Uncharacterized protein n=1 Tax=Puccinia graminis f. sp. tritici TaxID=56615 RepID=A0A5B0LX41_PUCGR|nr:hypothetical protein PGTUg99_035380 [Puccinia graminis f. sp. tritici]